MADKHPTPETAADEAGIRFDGGRAYRSTLDHGGRAHVDRALPFVILNRFDEGDTDSLARRVATMSPAYVVRPSNAECDRDPHAAVDAIAAKLCETYPPIISLSLYHLPPYNTPHEELTRAP